MTVTELAARVGLSVSPCHRRLRDLERSGAIRWYRAVVDPAGLASRSRNSPYAGRELPGRVVATFLRGVPTVLDGKAQR